MSYKIRGLQESDVSFIYSSYLKSLRPHRLNSTNTIFYTAEHKRLEWALLNGVTAVVVPGDNPNLIIGWANALFKPSSVNITYVYVKHAFRSCGLAKDLVKSLLETAPGSANKEYSIYVPAGGRLVQEFNLQFNPYIWDFIHLS